MSSTSDPTAKVLFRVPREDGSADLETLWAYDLGEDRYMLDNTPFYAYGVSLGDTVLALYDANEGRPVFARVLAKSGNRTVRVSFDQPVERGNASDVVLQGLVRLGCKYEGANPRYITIVVPAHIELSAVANYLSQCDACWEHADPTYEDLYPDDA